MRALSLSTRSVLVFVIFVFALAFGWSLSPAFAQAEEGGMIAWPEQEMAEALSLYLPRRVAEEDVPGLAIVVVRDGQIVYEQGFGSADYLGDEPVTPNTLFEAASLGKPVAALAALQMAQKGELQLDEPMGEELSEVWLGDGDDQALITLRQVLNHTSGLSNLVWCCSNEVWAEPGEGFSYSGVGFMYLAHVMSRVRELSFDRLMQQTVFEPLQMMSSGYGLADFLVPTVATGQVPLWRPVVALVVPFILFFAISSGLVVGYIRFYQERLRLELGDFLPALGFSIVATLVTIWVLIGGWDLLFILAYSLLYALLLGGIGFVIVLLFAFLGFLGPADGTLAQGREGPRGVMMAVAIGLSVLCSFSFANRNVPVPAMAGDTINAAFSFRSSAHDMGRFVEGLFDDRVVRSFFREKMASETVPVGGEIGWGLGMGTRDGATGRTLWQWGSNPGFESLMVVDPTRRAGIVVLTNSSKAAPLVQEIAGHVMGEMPGWQLP